MKTGHDRIQPMKKQTARLTALALLSLAWHLSQAVCPAAPETGENTPVVLPPHAGPMARLAAKEVRRYAYLRTGALLPVTEKRAASPAGIVLRVLPSLGKQVYRLKTTGNTLTISGGSETALLYGAYAFAEKLGVRFYLHGDVVPDRRIPWKLPRLDETCKPLFRLRGVNTWGRHPHGMDAWDADHYKAVLGQLAKLRMNFIGIHCYPEVPRFPEPTVWHGLPGDFDASGKVSQSYPTRYFSTLSTLFPRNYFRRKTDTFDFGAAQLFSDPAWSPDVLRGFCPFPKKPEACNTVFNRTGKQFDSAFSFARQLGVKTCLGTEAPLTIPANVAKRLKARGLAPSGPQAVRQVYEGTFRRIMAAHPLDYYWLWTPESWTWQGNSAKSYKATVADIKLACEALEKTGAPFRLATAGWVLGPGKGVRGRGGDAGQDRAAFDKDLPAHVSLSAISQNVGRVPVDPAFAMIRKGRDKWAIPWLEADYHEGLSALQLWAGMMRRDAVDAHRYGCTGLMGLHWRTTDLAPNVSALAQAAWDQSWHKDRQAGNLPRSLPADDFYADFARANFGLPEAGSVFASIDGKVPKVTNGGCPSGLPTPVRKPWAKEALRFAFVDDFEKLRPRVSGAGNLGRFDYWLSYFNYTRSLQKLRCALAKPVPGEIARLYSEAYSHLLEITTSPGALAMVVTMEIHVGWSQSIKKHIKKNLPKTYQGRPRLIVPTLRTVLDKGEAMRLKVFALSQRPLESLRAHFRPLGHGDWQSLPVRHIVNSVHEARFPAASGDFEYYLAAETADGHKLVWPATAPDLNQSVVVMDQEKQTH